MSGVDHIYRDLQVSRVLPVDPVCEAQNLRLPGEIMGIGD